MLIHGARAVVNAALRTSPDDEQLDPLARKARRLAWRMHRNKATVGIACQMARISRAVLSQGAEYDPRRFAGGSSR